jgi:hypothetical protein
MNPVLELQRLMSKMTAKRKLGKVLQVNGNTLTVSLGNTTTKVKNTTATNYKVGNVVSVQGDILLGKAGSGLQAKTFRV